MDLHGWKARFKIFMKDGKLYLVTMKKSTRTSTKTNALCPRKDSPNKSKATYGVTPSLKPKTKNSSEKRFLTTLTNFLILNRNKKRRVSLGTTLEVLITKQRLRLTSFKQLKVQV